MNVSTDQLLIMVVAATGLAVVVGGWAGGLVHAEATGLEELALRGGIGVVFVAALLGLWHVFSELDEESG
ncbi:hypothetical protein [Halobiforma nitratireducens]|uniref:Uncharacterized protein n=1 Tax=Halobiforma nitratireducens JCM 10879 TaxID=1227454 RepID=M0LAG7_9EURY|nr:hypothetical protein [Halobiforma nitratireducens]EMA30566.1 hypothetical protein C446_16410 [Halobiforma nitratireducens JCM 10879]